jgi:hypothetical protein
VHAFLTSQLYLLLVQWRERSPFQCVGGVVAAYTAEMERQFDIHRREARLAVIDDATAGQFRNSEEYQLKSDRLDKQTIKIQLHCKDRCRTIYHPRSPFSPDYSEWHKRHQIFRQLIAMQEGTVKNPGLLCIRQHKSLVLWHHSSGTSSRLFTRCRGQR